MIFMNHMSMGRLIPVFVFPHFGFYAALLGMPLAFTGLASLSFLVLAAAVFCVARVN